MPKATNLSALYSFPYPIGAGRICTTAWHQVDGLSQAGVHIQLHCGSVAKPLERAASIRKTLEKWRVRLPMRVFGRNRTLALHDLRVARWLTANAHSVDLVHSWPMASLRTLRAAKKLCIPTLLERPNAHTKFAFETVSKENKTVGINLPARHDHQINRRTLEKETLEFKLADYLLCPSEFVVQTFINEGFNKEKLLLHQYGYDQNRFRSSAKKEDNGEIRTFTLLYAGVCEPRKGLHYALRAWRDARGSVAGEFLICGTFVPGYKEAMADLLSDPSVKILGHRDDLPELMRRADAFVLPSVEEGSALVTYEARASGCVLLVSDATGAKCQDGHDGLVHHVRDTAMLTSQLESLINDRDLVRSLKEKSLQSTDTLTWEHAGERLAELYRKVVVSSV